MDRSLTLFWENPILWLPLVCADLLVFCFTRLQKLLTRQLIDSLLLNHPALTGQAIRPVAQPALIMKAAVLNGSFVWGTYFLNTCLYTVAFVITATLVHTLGQDMQPDLPVVFAFIGIAQPANPGFLRQATRTVCALGALLVQATRGSPRSGASRPHILFLDS